MNKIKGDRITWRLGDCPKCSGDMYFDEHDEFPHAKANGYVWICVQCGYREYMRETTEIIKAEG